ncbi:sigma-54-dependent transcriptional regulator [Pedobacter sp. MW01-1-1]|uniref:sigma-54-dependent transcriptional regulator n=1 Tax=Pedobacter sp. MW01-1-1 TaxID=3383027 RepID=UPI003FED5565
MAKILILEDDTAFAQLLENYLVRNHFQITLCTQVKQAVKLIEKNDFDLLLLDYRLPDGTGFDVLSQTRDLGIHMPIIIMTSFNDVRTAVKSIQLGAFDYITKPINPDELLMVIRDSLSKKEHKKESPKNVVPNLIKGESALATKLHEHINLVAPTNLSVLIQGESGTGKEYVARTLHKESNRADHIFISIDCGALSKDLAASELFGHVKGAFTGALNDKKGQFELADGGTLFLDEVGNLSYEVQVKLLRALQERVISPVGSEKQIHVNVRILAATNDDLTNSIQQGEFREDLYHRLNEFKIQLPPLRERGKDIELFIAHFIEQSNHDLGRKVKALSPETKSLLLKYDWPGNLRELSNVIKRMVLLTKDEVAQIDALPDEMANAVKEQQLPSATSDLKFMQEQNEKLLITETLIKVKYNKSKAAKLLNIDRKTLYSKMERYGID